MCHSFFHELKKLQKLFQVIYLFQFGEVQFAKNISAEKMLNRSICQRQFANSRFAKNHCFQHFILSAVKSRFAKLRFAD